jgi:glutaminyl-peptide cyclotransferase
MRAHCRPERSRGVSATVALISLLAVLLCFNRPVAVAAEPSTQPQGAVEEIPFDGRRALGYLRRICNIGPRPSGSPGMEQQQELVLHHFKKLGGKVDRQRFRAPHPLLSTRVPMANVICQWDGDAKERILLATHYDTRPLPDRDPNTWRRRNGTFIGANDGASGVALLMELAHWMPQIECRYGIDFVLLDGEEFVFDDRHPYFLGSQWFAQQYIKRPPPYRYRWGVLLDMVGDANLRIYQERYSMNWPDTRPLVLDLWAAARRIGVDEFIDRRGQAVRDDHLKLRNIAKIPTCNIIDFDYPYWHTEGDTPDKCSAQSLAKVGRVVSEWLRTVQ